MSIENKFQERFELKDSVELRIKRQNPKEDPHLETFSVRASESTTILEALLFLHETECPSLQIRYSCRMAICGSCGMLINGLPRLACNTRILGLKSKKVTIEPLPNFPVVRDLVTQMSGLFDKHKKVKPFLIRKDTVEQENPQKEFHQSESELDSFAQFTHCVTCGLCVAACPTASTDVLFIGPQALGQAYRYNADSRDEGSKERKDILDSEHGIWRCHFAGSCTYVCPKGVDPALAIQLMRGQMIKDSFKFNRKKREIEAK
ncbi:MAG: succinate dehydrogenase/fumarate reductase iron-sulfur subunit [Nitrososphaerales archaeon]